MPIIPKLECRVETFREDDAVFMRIGIHQEEMLLAYYAFDTLLTGFADKIALHDHENGTDCEIVLAPAKLMTDAQISLTVNDIECIKKLLHDCIEQPYYVSWLHDDLTAGRKRARWTWRCMWSGKRNSEVFGKKQNGRPCKMAVCRFVFGNVIALKYLPPASPAAHTSKTSCSRGRSRTRAPAPCPV